jgi:ATP-dependent Clp protease ATP-binding subunit ClpX
MTEQRFTPIALVRYLDRYIIGHDEAKRAMAVAIYAHLRKVERARRDSRRIIKSNVLRVGPTGSGKTFLCETLARALRVPFVTAEATSLSQARHVVDEIEAIMQRLVDGAGGDLERAQLGIVFIDEIDKLKVRAVEIGGHSGESVQHALLKIMEGSMVRLADGRYIDTTHVLFICGGAFVGLDKIADSGHAYGYISTTGGEDLRILDRLNKRIKPTDLVEFGLIPEFTGRLPITVRFEALTKELLVRIMTEPQDCLFKQYSELLAAEGVDLVGAREAFEQIADLAVQYQTGARSLRGVFEELIAPALYAAPDDPNLRRVEVESIFSEPRLVRGPARGSDRPANSVPTRG